MRTLIEGGTIVSDGRRFSGSIVIDGEQITDIIEGTRRPEGQFDQRTDASGCFVLPGVIDDHVHFREPGLTAKADIDSESCAAAAGGVTTYFDMPNTIPQTTTLERLDDKFLMAAAHSHVNYSFFFGATNENAEDFQRLDAHRIPGIKLFMGSSTGNMLVDRRQALDAVFSQASGRFPVMTHCEDTAVIARNQQSGLIHVSKRYPAAAHSAIRSTEACVKSTRLAISLARKHQARLHVAHVSTADELALPQITAEVVLGHLLFSQKDYYTEHSKIKVNPSIKSARDRDALRRALTQAGSPVFVVGTDHAPHLLEEKRGARAVSGMPMVQFSLVAMLELADLGVLLIERVVELMCHNPARLFEVRRRGFLRPGYQADIVIVSPQEPWTVTRELIQSKCQWSPLEGHEFRWRVVETFCNGHAVYRDGRVDRSYIGQAIEFR